MESAGGIFPLSNFIVAQPVLHKPVQAIRMTSLLHYQQIHLMRTPERDVAMCTMFCLDDKEAELLFCIVKNIVLKMSWKSGFLKEEFGN